VIYDRIHSRDIARYGGLADRMPLYATVFMVFTLGAVGLPGTSGFPGEIFTLIGAFRVSFWLALLGSTGMILSVIYMLYLYRRVIFGRLVRADLMNILDLSPRELAVFAPLVFLTLWMGVYPASFTDFFRPSVNALVERHKTAMTAQHRLASNTQPRPLHRHCEGRSDEAIQGNGTAPALDCFASLAMPEGRKVVAVEGVAR